HAGAEGARVGARPVRAAQDDGKAARRPLPDRAGAHRRAEEALRVGALAADRGALRDPRRDGRLGADPGSSARRVPAAAAARPRAAAPPRPRAAAPSGRTSPAAMTRWYAGGLRFACRRCGNCCSGKGSVVVVSPREVEALARVAGMTVAAFGERHTREAFGDTVLVDRDDGSCEWLDRAEDGTTSCRVQDAKPDQCRAYP